MVPSDQEMLPITIIAKAMVDNKIRRTEGIIMYFDSINKKTIISTISSNGMNVTTIKSSGSIRVPAISAIRSRKWKIIMYFFIIEIFSPQTFFLMLPAQWEEQSYSHRHAVMQHFVLLLN